MTFNQFYFFSIFAFAVRQSLLATPLFFVHLGNPLPDYTLTCFKQARLFHTDAIYLIAPAEALSATINQKLHALCITHIPLEVLELTLAHKNFLKKTPLKSFWRYTTERFFYLEEGMRYVKVNRCIHMEYDNMLYLDTNILNDPLWLKNIGMAATFDNDDRGIAGFIIINNIDTLSEFNEFIATAANLGKNDMELLAMYKNSIGNGNSSTIISLPVIMPEYVHDFPLITPTGKKAKDASCYTGLCAKIGYLFDAAALGQYIGGIDPRNGESKPGFINESCVFNPSKLQFNWIIDEKHRRIPFACYHDTQLPIANLHIHSKKLDDFTSY